MPFNKKKDAEGNEIDFDFVYRALIKPAIEAADMEPIRADEENVSGIIHKPMYERLILCDYAIADLTTANANVFYELGIRHVVKPYTTITLFSAGSKLPFDVNFLRGMPYDYDFQHQLIHLEKDKANLTTKLLQAKKEKTTDSPIYQLIDGVKFQNSVAHEKTDIFRDKVKYDNDLKDRLKRAREIKASKAERLQAVEAIVKELVLENEETGVLIDVMLSYRALGAFEQMIYFIQVLPAHVKQTVMVQEQLGFALNRTGQKKEAISVLEKVLQENGPSSETYGILGRVYKDLFEEALNSNNEFLADSHLDQAIETYLKGFEADWRDAYPGINAVTLLELKGNQEKNKRLVPVVEYAVLRKMASKKPDYWDYATLMELAIIENEEAKAVGHLRKALACPIESAWMFDTTLKNLNFINTYRKKRKEDNSVSQKLIDLLQAQKEAFS